jgi:glycine cleavage system H protein
LPDLPGLSVQSHFDLPPDLLFAAEQDMWLRLDADGVCTVGVVHLFAAHGQFMFFAPRPVGSEVAFDRSLGVMETAKTAVAIHAPIACRVLAVNQAVERDIEWIAREPYGAGWLFQVTPTAWPADRARLMSAADYALWLAPRLAERSARPIEDGSV